MAWQDFLSTQGAQFDAHNAAAFNNSRGLAALQNSAALVPLTHFGLIRFSGEETIAFLHGQLSSDVKKLTTNTCQYSSYSTPKGRMLASLLILPEAEDRLLMLPRDLAPTIQKRLSMFVMRSKTKASNASDERILLGLAGPEAARLVQQVLTTELPGESMQVSSINDGWLIRLGADRFLLNVLPGSAETIWQKLCTAGATPAGADCWTLSDIRAGIPWIQSTTQEAFVPQMANMELIGAVSFKKGCYPGQEIVARTQYLGKLKRRTFRVVADTAMQVGDAIYSPEMNGQASGQIALAAPLGDGSWEALAVVQLSSLEHGIHLNNQEGPRLSVLELPYAVHE
ncbi:CAF17-like 4Fe-4S cluster assembly/insertion protein YgfZ [Chitinimonas sp. PSY-7]|uniref:CAF17-like 4Fe-4S cluster assembly/insertion protein YgfZ n=1 Tax=Chitinimonas sp. PSY-7 TaxID=3459088 RepID=UPI00403FDC96